MRTLDEPEYGAIWDAFEEAFRFRPSVNGPFPAIIEPPRSITFRLRDTHDDDAVDELRAAVQAGFEAARAFDASIYYLDWQHQCFAVDGRDDRWDFTGYPDGDYAILLSKELTCGSFGHPWEPSICLFGDPFVEEVLRRRPRIFERLLRNSGGYRF